MTTSGESLRVWHSVVSDPPPQGVVVEVNYNGGAHLLLDGRLWWLPDRSMYVYFTPTYWRHIHWPSDG